MSAEGSGPPPLPALTSLRFFAALLVVVCHYFQVPTGGAGVAFFFVLSGFILAYNHAGLRPTRQQRADFWFRRFARIYPTHLLTFLMIMAVVPIGFPEGLPSPALYAEDGLCALANLMLVQGFFPSQAVFLSFNKVSWSISCEAFFYLVFPFALVFLRRQTRVMALALVLAPLALVTWCAVLWTATHWPVSRDEPAILWPFYIFPPTRLAEFLLGVWLGLAYVTRPWRSGPRRQLAALAAWGPGIAAAALLSPRFGPLILSGWYAPMSLLTLYAFAPLRHGDGAVSRFFASRRLQKLGQASFWLYMSHMVVFLYAIRLISHFLHHIYNPGWIFKGAAIPVAIGVSLLGYSRYEHPMQRALGRWWHRRKRLGEEVDAATEKGFMPASAGVAAERGVVPTETRAERAR